MTQTSPTAPAAPAALPKMLFDPSAGFYCTYCDYYFQSELDRSGLPDSPVRWIAWHKANRGGTADPPLDCPFEGKMFEIDVTEVLPEAREVGKKL